MKSRNALSAIHENSEPQWGIYTSHLLDHVEYPVTTLLDVVEELREFPMSEALDDLAEAANIYHHTAENLKQGIVYLSHLDAEARLEILIPIILHRANTIGRLQTLISRLLEVVEEKGHTSFSRLKMYLAGTRFHWHKMMKGIARIEGENLNALYKHLLDPVPRQERSRAFKNPARQVEMFTKITRRYHIDVTSLLRAHGISIKSSVALN